MDNYLETESYEAIEKINSLYRHYLKMKHDFTEDFSSNVYSNILEQIESTHSFEKSDEILNDMLEVYFFKNTSDFNGYFTELKDIHLKFLFLVEVNSYFKELSENKKIFKLLPSNVKHDIKQYFTMYDKIQ